MNALLHPTYLPNIATFAVLAQSDVIWEVCDNFQKQTYRNRAYICTDRGKLMLNIPIQHVGGSQGRQKYRDVKIDNSSNWQRQHWRTLETAYRTSPYFEFYEDDIYPLFNGENKYLLDFNLKSIDIICDCLQITSPTTKTKTFEFECKRSIDMRHLVDAKNGFDFTQPEYIQVFSDRHGFVKNVSVLDLLFNEGTNALSYLKNLTIASTNA